MLYNVCIIPFCVNNIYYLLFFFRFRNAKRYNTPLTPLLHIEWWRLCLDEAQMVDSSTSQVSLMTHQLTAIHRWAVTGTPIQKNIFDLYGIIECLKLTPYNDIEVWNNLLYYPYCNENKQSMINFLAEIMWRSSKMDVIDQVYFFIISM